MDRALLVALAVLTACHRDDRQTSSAEASSAALSDDELEVSSPSFPNQGAIPTKFTCEGENSSPALVWSDVPSATKSFVVMMEDPDAPDPRAPERVFVHRLLYNLSPNARHVPEGARMGANIAGGALDGLNDYGRTGYSGPCPPVGRHRYVQKVVALDVMLPDLGKPTKPELERAMAGHVLATGELVGTYEKQPR